MTATPDRPATAPAAPADAPVPAEAPIFESLVEEQGDVLAETREAAQATQEEAAEALDWSDLHPEPEAEADRPTHAGRSGGTA